MEEYASNYQSCELVLSIRRVLKFAEKVSKNFLCYFSGFSPRFFPFFFFFLFFQLNTNWTEVAAIFKIRRVGEELSQSFGNFWNISSRNCIAFQLNARKENWPRRNEFDTRMYIHTCSFSLSICIFLKKRSNKSLSLAYLSIACINISAQCGSLFYTSVNRFIYNRNETRNDRSTYICTYLESASRVFLLSILAIKYLSLLCYYDKILISFLL